MADREKSAPYPGATWAECLDLIKKRDMFKLNSVSYQALAEKYGLKNPSTKSFTARISAAKQFGLITTKGNAVQLTVSGRQILYPTGNGDRQNELVCFAQPPLYEKLITRYDGSALPSIPTLANILLNEYGITRAVKEVAARCFVESAEQLGILKGGVLCYSEAQNDNFETDAEQVYNSVEEKADKQETVEREVQQELLRIAPIEADYITQSIPLESGKVAKFIIPVDATEDDLLLLRDMFDVLLKRKFKISI